MAYFSRPQVLSLAAQLNALQRHFPFGEGRIGLSRKGCRFKWRQTIRPHVLGDAYTIELRLVEGVCSFSEVLAIEPDLRTLAVDRNLPHVYPEVDDHVCLCLY